MGQIPKVNGIGLVIQPTSCTELSRLLLWKNRGQIALAGDVSFKGKGSS